MSFFEWAKSNNCTPDEIRKCAVFLLTKRNADFMAFVERMIKK